jgi:hypothetical protein
LQNGNLAGRSSTEIKIWDKTTGFLKITLTEHQSFVLELAVLDLASASRDGTTKI